MTQESRTLPPTSPADLLDPAAPLRPGGIGLVARPATEGLPRGRQHPVGNTDKVRRGAV